MRIVVALLLVVAAAFCASAQTLTLYNIDTTGYPVIRASYVANDGNNRAYEGLTSADFTVIEKIGEGSMVDLTASIKQGCTEATPDSAASLLIVMDLSGSMTHLVKGVPRIDIAKRALRTLIGQLSFTGGTKVCIIGFSSRARMICPWSSDAATIISAINGMRTNGGTNYEDPFAGDPNIFDEFLKCDPLIPKTAIFITDGRPQPQIADPARWVDTTGQMCIDQSIVLHSVSVDLITTYEPLEELCRRTGGTSHVGTDAALDSMIASASIAASTKRSCFIEWESPLGCGVGERLRTAFVTLKKDIEPKDTVPYTSALLSTAIVERDIPVLDFGVRASGESAEAVATFTAITYEWIVKGFTISPSANFEVIDWNYPLGERTAPSPLKPMIFERGVPRSVLVKFRQGATALNHQGELRLQGDECSLIQPMRAGSSTAIVVVKTPNGGEVYSTCGDTVDIRWTGVSDNAEVTIEWSADDTTWNVIATNATGNLYKWVPKETGVTYKIRIRHVPPGHYAWVHHIGHTGADTVSSVVVSPTSKHTFITGWYNGSTQFGNGLVFNPIGAIDGFLQELDTNGRTVRTFTLTGTISKNERIVGAVVDKAGNVYIAGVFESGKAVLSNGRDTMMLTAPLAVRDDTSGSYAITSFVIKISENGKPLWVRYAAGLPSTTGRVRAHSIGIREDSTGPSQIVLSGTFQDFIYMGITKSGQYLQLGPGIKSSTFSTTIDFNGSPTSLSTASALSDHLYTSKSARDAEGNFYSGDNFHGRFEREAFDISAFGSESDVYVSCRKAGPMVSDVSDASFTVFRPELSLGSTTLTMQETFVKQTTTTLFEKRLCNTSKYPVRIQNVEISGPHAKEFVLDRVLSGRVLAPNECIDIAFRFKPEGSGLRTATLNVIGNCNSLVSVALEGNAQRLCAIDLMDTIRLENIKLGTRHSVTHCILKNLGSASITVTARLEPPSAGFDVEPKGPVTLIPLQCLNATITFDGASAGVGTYSGRIVYDLPANCGEASSELQASVVDSVVPVRDTNVVIESVDWFTRRVGTVNDTIIKLVNNSDDPVVIESITIGQLAPDITLTSTYPPLLPALLQVGDSIAIGLRYAPSVRGAQTVDVSAVVTGLKNPVKGLAKGRGVLPSISATGDSWPSTPVMALASKVGRVEIRNTDLDAVLRIGDVRVIDDAQLDFRLIMPQTLSFPYLIAPGASLSIPVEFTPQQVGNRTQPVLILHDAMPGPDPLPVLAETIVDLIGIGEAGSPLDPVTFNQTLTCDTTVASFWLKNPSPTDPMVIDEITESDPDGVFDLTSAGTIKIAPLDSTECFVRFAPQQSRVYRATMSFVSTKGVTQYATCTGEGQTTPLQSSIVALQMVVPGTIVSVPLKVRPSAPYFTRPLPMRIELDFAQQSLAYVDARIAPYSASITGVDVSKPGRVVFDVIGSVDDEVIVTPSFRSLLASDTTVAMSMHVASGYPCVLGDTTQAVITFARPCAGASRVVSLGASAFALQQLYPTPASDQLTVRYAIGYQAAVTLDVMDALGNTVSTMVVPEAPAAQYDLDLVTQGLSAGYYVLRMTSGHFVASQIFTVAR